MADNETIKALECCSSYCCNECSYYNDDLCTENMQKQAIDLINRQKAEIEENNLKIDHQAQIIKTLEVALDNKMAEIEKMKALLKSGGEYINCLEKEMTESQ